MSKNFSNTSKIPHGGHTGKSLREKSIQSAELELLKSQSSQNDIELRIEINFQKQLLQVRKELLGSLENLDLSSNDKNVKQQYQSLKKDLRENSESIQENKNEISKLKQILEFTSDNLDNKSSIKKEVELTDENDELINMTNDIQNLFISENKTLLLSNHDNRGDYYDIKNNHGDEIKFYFREENAKLNQTLTKVEDFPNWCKAFSQFCFDWNFDNLIQNEKLTDSEEQVLRKVIKDSVGPRFTFYEAKNFKASKIFNDLKKHALDICPRSSKDAMWKKVFITRSCSDVNELQSILNNLLMIEYYVADPEEKELTFEFLNKKILRTLSEDLEGKVKFHLLEEKLNVKDANPHTIIEFVSDEIKNAYKRNDIFYIEAKKCYSCGSVLHTQKQCKNKTFQNDGASFQRSDQNTELRPTDNTRK